MNRPELYTKTVNKILTAYEKGELLHGKCSACVVGNLCDGDITWSKLFFTLRNTKIQKYFFGHKDSYFIAEQLRKKTGYSVPELMKLEYAFETAPGIEKFTLRLGDGKEYIGSFDFMTGPEYMYNGLKAVLEVLAKIHELNEVDEESIRKLNIVHDQLESVQLK